MKAGDLATLLRGLSSERPVLIAGPTASGKSALALEIARAQGRRIVNSDALQVHAAWRVLTARPSPEDEASVPHLLYGHLLPGGEHSVGHWLREVQGLLTGGPVVIVGGTGLFLSALTEGLAVIPPVPGDVRAEANALLLRGGLDAMRAALDPATATRIDLANPARVQRAWEVLRATGRGLASWQAETGPPLVPLRAAQALRLDADPDWLGHRIDGRFATMLRTGALEEAAAALPGWNPAAPASRAIGAADLIAHLRGEITLHAAEAAARIATRQYAKRQRTWLRARMKDWRGIALP